MVPRKKKLVYRRHIIKIKKIDTIIQHGFQYTEPDINIVRLLALTGGRKENETEQAFLTRFLTVRRQLQCCYP